MANTRAREAERGRLTKQAVVQRALALADADGLDALTIRRLATELGVTPMALYWHFRNKEELLAGLLLFRVLYYLVPFVLSLGILALRETLIGLRRRRRMAKP